MITALGKELRRLRIDEDELIFDMAERIGSSPAFVSAVGNGRKAPTPGFVESVIQAYGLTGEKAAGIRKAATAINTMTDRHSDKGPPVVSPRLQRVRDLQAKYIKMKLNREKLQREYIMKAKRND